VQTFPRDTENSYKKFVTLKIPGKHPENISVYLATCFQGRKGRQKLSRASTKNASEK
jgi:hypothetical protein